MFTGQGSRDLARDLVLHLKDVLHLAVVALRPERKIGRRVDYPKFALAYAAIANACALIYCNYGRDEVWPIPPDPSERTTLLC